MAGSAPPVCGKFRTGGEMINSREINALEPCVAVLCHKFIADCRAQGIDCLVTSTFRDAESQNALYAQGRTMPGAIVTNAKGGQSWHNWRCAFDMVPIVHGKAQWNDMETFRKCGEIGKKLGLEWAGDWRKFKEYAHFQLTQGLTLADFRAGKRLA
jgi:peptidoglycan L-alanyl-D-glutamate endopeptidase CwlK